MTTRDRSAIRLAAVAQAGSRKAKPFQRPTDSQGNVLKTSRFFGQNTFSYEQLGEKLSPAQIATLREFATSNQPLSLEIADKVAAAVKEWALARGATHYCHWFQPQTGATAEKHDSFFSFDRKNAAVEHFTGKQLIQSEPDASSFPSGGRRSTFEARGYTAWDASSPMFLMETDNGCTLCIPSVFISYSGEALDKKTPLLRSIAALNARAVDALKLLGAPAEHVVATAGPEQEYFVIDEALYTLRPDLIQAGRTLLGRTPPKGQQLEDHYFGSIKPRILSFMMEAEQEMYRLGIPCKTRHNEVAPSQCELAPIFEHANVAADHNQLAMEVLRSVAKRHGLVTLFHEKPYAGMNGSGKHVNWSMADSNGHNLLEPGDAPQENVRFLYFLTAAIKAVHDNGALLRSAVASPGNDFRLGANEAPPAIMSVFLGETLAEVLDRLEKSDNNMTQRERTINLDLAKVPVIARDNTDRNRTSPFAFTGNKFEFRAVGASASISPALTYLNASVAKSLEEMNQKLKARIGTAASASANDILAVIKETYSATKKVCFEGNNYSTEWHKEAERRGLPHAKATPDALQVLRDPKVKTLLNDLGIHGPHEMEARYNVRIERYLKVRLIELETMLELISGHVLPAAEAQLADSGESLAVTQTVLGQIPAERKQAFATLSQHTAKLIQQRDQLAQFLKSCQNTHDETAVAKSIAEEGMRIMQDLRDNASEIELYVDYHLWSLPKYREMVYMM